MCICVCEDEKTQAETSYFIVRSKTFQIISFRAMCVVNVLSAAQMADNSNIYCS